MKFFRKLHNFFASTVAPIARDLLVRSLLIVVDFLDCSSMLVYASVHGLTNYWAPSA